MTSYQARVLIGDWRKVLNAYRAASKRISQKYMSLTEAAEEEDKIALIEIFGKQKYFIDQLKLNLHLFLYFE